MVWRFKGNKVCKDILPPLIQLASLRRKMRRKENWFTQCCLVQLSHSNWKNIFLIKYFRRVPSHSWKPVPVRSPLFTCLLPFCPSEFIGIMNNSYFFFFFFLILCDWCLAYCKYQHQIIKTGLVWHQIKYKVLNPMCCSTLAILLKKTRNFLSWIDTMEEVLIYICHEGSLQYESAPQG